jgi:hypothetical protein
VSSAPQPARASVRLIPPPESEEVPEEGAVDSMQEARLLVVAAALGDLWTRAYLERLANAYWAYLRRISLGVLRTAHDPDGGRTVRLAGAIGLLRFHAAAYSIDERTGSVEWRIDRGLLVAKSGRGRGFLRFDLVREGEPPPGAQAEITVRASVRNFYPWLRGTGRFARIGTRLYGATQLRIHVWVTQGFLRSISRLEVGDRAA